MQEEDTETLHDGSEDRCGVETPAPCRVLADKTAGDWTDGGTEKRREGVNGNCFSTLLRLEAVTEDTLGLLAGENGTMRKYAYTTNCQRRRTAQTTEEPECHQLPRGLSETTSKVPCQVEQVR